jgi:hypothetical protein
MSDIAILRNLIRESATIPIKEDSYGNRVAVLNEPQEANSSVTIRGLPEDVFIIKADLFAAPTTVFNNSRGECKRADFVIIAAGSDSKTIVYIELKSGKGDNQEIKQQLKGASCFIAYCREIGRAFWEQTDFLEGYTQWFISIGYVSIDKRPTTNSRKSKTHDHPERMLKVNGRYPIQFRKLIEGA